MKLSALTSVRYAAVAAVAALALSSCSLGGSAVPQEELEKDVAAQLNEQSGEDNSATCEGDLEAEDDATQQCTWESDEGEEVPVEVTATTVGDEDVEYRIEPQDPVSDDGPPAVPRDEVEKDVAAQLNKQSGQSGSATCDGDLEPDLDATQQCAWQAGDDEETRVEVTVTEIRGGQVKYSIQPQEGQTTGTPVAQDVLEQKVRAFFEDETGKSFPVTCEGDLDGEVGATQRCMWNASDGSTLGVDVKLTGYSGGQANFNIQADDKATPAPKS